MTDLPNLGSEPPPLLEWNSGWVDPSTGMWRAQASTSPHAVGGSKTISPVPPTHQEKSAAPRAAEEEAAGAVVAIDGGCVLPETCTVGERFDARLTDTRARVPDMLLYEGAAFSCACDAMPAVPAAVQAAMAEELADSNGPRTPGPAPAIG